MRNQNAIEVAGFPITPDVMLKKRDTHLGLAFEIVNSSRSTIDWASIGEPKLRHADSGGTWCYYVVISEAQLESSDFAEFWLPAVVTPHKSGWPRVHFDYYAARFAQAEWHGGVTFYEQGGGQYGEQRYVKIGCDFAHSWDEGITFDYSRVEYEAKETIEQLTNMYDFKRRCPYFGTYHADAEMVTHPLTGALYSKAGFDAMLESK